jgi:cyanosortase A-associated protein
MKNMPSLRLSFLTLTFVSVFAVLLKVAIEPKAGTNLAKYNPYVFPETIPLAQWKLEKSQAVNPPKTEDKQFFGGKNYQYSRDKVKVNIDMHYLVNTTGNVNTYLKDYYFKKSSEKHPNLRVKEAPKVGFYNVFLYEEKIQIVSCINPSGGATANVSQFFLNRQRYDYSNNNGGGNKLVSWFLGQEELQDRRCMWAHLSMPVGNLPPEKAFEQIEKVWFSWYDWWQTNFPRA